MGVDPFIVWSNLYYRASKRRDLFAVDLSSRSVQDLSQLLPGKDREMEMLAWSSGTIKGRRFVSYTAFDKRYKCCVKGEANLVLFSMDKGPRAPQISLEKTCMPYYPTGIILNPNNRLEALVPKSGTTRVRCGEFSSR